ncbi:hypothetical protein MTR67_031120 [Solanum verrucosum]
MKRFQ